MGFENGHSKIGGRKKGTQNKDSKKIRDAVKKYCAEEIEDILNEIGKLEGKDKVEYFLKLLEYGIGKINRVDLSNESGDLNVNITPMQFVKSQNAEHK